MAERENNDDRGAGLISVVVPFHDEAPGVAPNANGQAAQTPLAWIPPEPLPPSTPIASPSRS